jgi:hypothetical protein
MARYAKPKGDHLQMHPRQAALLDQADNLTEKLAAKQGQGGSPVLWKYVDDENGEFFLPTRRQNVHSPYTGKSMPQRPEKFQIPAIQKELKQEMKGAPGPKAGSPKGRKQASDPAWKADVQPKSNA